MSVLLCEHITPDSDSVAVKSCNYSQIDQGFIASEIKQMLRGNTLDKSKSPW